jgi:glutaredoxin 3
MREWLEWRGCDFVEYDVESDLDAFARMRQLTAGQLIVPVLIEDGKLIQSGWQGRGCVLSERPGHKPRVERVSSSRWEW